MKTTIIHQIAVRYKEWKLRRIRKKVVIKLLSNPKHNPDTYGTTDLAYTIVEYITKGVVRN